MKIQNFTYILISTFLILFLLFIGEKFFIPLLIAICLWYLIITLADSFKIFKIGSNRISHVAAVIMSIVTLIIVFSVFMALVNNNIARVITLAPEYQHKAMLVANSFMTRLGVQESFGFGEMINSVDTESIVFGITNLFKTIASYTGIVLIYTLFLLLEYRMFGKKIKYIFTDKKKYKSFMKSLEKINQDIRTYVKIKTSSSLITAVLSFIVMAAVRVDLAVFWALLIFILNFIPTIGSIIAVSFPILLSVVQFDSWLPTIILSIFLVSIQIVIGNILEPRFMGKSLNLSPLVIILSLSIWGSIWGIVGMFLCIPIMVILNIILAKFDKTRGLAVMFSARGKVN
jgi:predicted PurR-regulated permease PerM